MVNFIQKRLQVFVSSTYTDLKVERQAAVEAILVAGHIPAGMELFTSGDESQMEVINQWIDESDVYLLILGGRYGSIEPRTGKSYTQLEYEYAAAKLKPLFACVIQDGALEARVRTQGRSVIETDQPQKLKDFQNQVLGKMVRFWSDEKDIRIAVAETLSHFSRREDLAGWVRANTQADMPALADEIARLSRENAQLRSRATPPAEHLIHGLSFEELEALLENKGLLRFFVNKRREFASEMGYSPEFNAFFEVHCTELVAVGLLQRLHGSNFIFTDAGRAFLNKYQVKRVSTTSEPE